MDAFLIVQNGEMKMNDESAEIVEQEQDDSIYAEQEHSDLAEAGLDIESDEAE